MSLSEEFTDPASIRGVYHLSLSGEFFRLILSQEFTTGVYQRSLPPDSIRGVYHRSLSEVFTT